MNFYLLLVFCRLSRESLFRMELECKVMGDGSSGAAHPVYEHEGRKWVLLSVPDEHYHVTGLPA